MAQTPGIIGITQALDASAKTIGARELHSLDHLEVSIISTSGMQDYSSDGRKRTVNLDNVTYTAPEDIHMWKKIGSTPTEYSSDFCFGFQIKIESGYSLNISKLYARLLVNSDSKWKVEIVDVSKGTTLYTSADKTSTTSSTASINAELKEKQLTGEIRVLLYVIHTGQNKYYVADNLTIEGLVEADSRPTHTITTSVDANGGGTVSPSGEFSCIVGESAKIEAVANTGYSFVSWLIDDKETVTTNPYTFENVKADHTAVATFAKNPVLSFAKPEGVYCVDRMFPKGVNTVAKGGKATLPAANYMYYKEGYTMTGWKVGGTEYGFGKEVTLTENVTAEPVFAKNTVSLAARSDEVTVTYDFNTSTNDGRLVNIQYNADKVITEATVDGKKIDVMMDADCKNGKLNNVNNDGKTAQCNQGTVLTIHDAVKGSVITLTCNSKFTTATTFNGAAGTLDGSKAIYTATEDGDVTVYVGDKNISLTTITVTYPYVPKSYTLTTKDDGFYTLYLDYAVTVPENITVYTGALNGSTLTLNAVTDGYIKAGNAVIVKGTAAGTYTFTEKKDAEAGTYEGNALKGVTVETAVADLKAAGIVLTLGVKDGKVGFRKPNNGMVSANKAYLDYVVAPAAGAPTFVNILLPGEATGIQGIQSVQQKSADSAIYNMMGQRVGANAKGLILMNGKKVIRK